MSWWGEGEILFRFVCVPDSGTTINLLFPFLFLQTFKRWWRVNFFQGEGDSRVHSNFFGGRGEGLVQSPGSRVQSLQSRVQGSLQLLGYAVPAVIVKCWKVAYWDAKKLRKNCQKSKNWLLKSQKLLPNFLHIFI